MRMVRRHNAKHFAVASGSALEPWRHPARCPWQVYGNKSTVPKVEQIQDQEILEKITASEVRRAEAVTVVEGSPRPKGRGEG